jgi:sensor histidine kinase YesM
MWLYFVLLLVIIIAGTFIRLRIEKVFVNENFPELARIPVQRIGFVAGTIVVLLLLSTAYRLMADHFSAQDQKREMMKEKADAELKFLKTQINPHFLFNTLNNLYALAYSGSENTAPGIMALSQMMRYLLYETGQEVVRLKKELDFVLNYIELEKLRLENSDSIRIDFDEDHPEMMIAPLIFIPFIENSFKHSRIIDDAEAWIEISIKTGSGKILFKCSNSIPQKQVKKDTNGGVGLENITKRLQLIYPGRHSIRMTNESNKFNVELEITIDEI